MRWRRRRFKRMRKQVRLVAQRAAIARAVIVELNRRAATGEFDREMGLP